MEIGSNVVYFYVVSLAVSFFFLFGKIFIIAKIMTTLLRFSSDVEVKGKELITELTQGGLPSA